MIANTGGRRRLGRLAGAVAAGVLAVGAVSLSATAGSAATTAAATAGAAGTAGVTAQARAQVPWSKVGPGWELAEYTTVPAGKAVPVTLYLISPTGARYPMHTWGALVTVPFLIAWSGDKTRAMLGLDGNRYEQLTLKTGQLTVGQLAGQARPTGYSLPGGADILGVTFTAAGDTVARYSLAGKLLKTLAHGADESTAAIPILPPAPALSSMMICWPSFSDRYCPTIRATMSLAFVATMIRPIGRPIRRAE